MVVPVGQTVQITLVSDDVIHGFYVRDFNFSRYALPGVTNYFDLNVLHAGIYNGQCTQICGLYHSEMLFSVRAVSPAAFTAVGQRRGAQPATPCSARAPRPRTIRPPTPTSPNGQRPARHPAAGKGRSMTTTIEPP